MDDLFNKTKGFGEILDHIFQLVKSYFAPFFLIFLFILGPVFLLEAILLLVSGTSFFRQLGVGGNRFEQIIMGFDEPIFSRAEEISNMISFATLVLVPLGTISILQAVQKIKNKEDFTPGGMIKQASKRFGPVLGSSLIVGIVFFFTFIIILVAIIVTGVVAFDNSSVAIVIFGLVLLLGISLLIALWFSRWGFYMAAVYFKESFPGIGYSWRLTKKNTLRVFGLFLTIGLITGIVSAAINGFFGAILGNSVLFSIISNLILILTYMISAVAYAVIYYDLKVRQGGEDLQDMIDEYQNE